MALSTVNRNLLIAGGGLLAGVGAQHVINDQLVSTQELGSTAGQPSATRPMTSDALITRLGSAAIVGALGIGTGLARRGDPQQFERLLLLGMAGLTSTAVSVSLTADKNGLFALDNLATMATILGTGFALGAATRVPGRMAEGIAFAALGGAAGMVAPSTIHRVGEDIAGIRHSLDIKDNNTQGAGQ